VATHCVLVCGGVRGKTATVSTATALARGKARVWRALVAAAMLRVQRGGQGVCVAVALRVSRTCPRVHSCDTSGMLWGFGRAWCGVVTAFLSIWPVLGSVGERGGELWRGGQGGE
jgi:hypothetical protein